MFRSRLITCSLFLLAVVSASAADRGSLLVDSYGKLLRIGTDGSVRILAPSFGIAALSPDGQKTAFTWNEDPKNPQRTSQILSLIPSDGGTAQKIVQLPQGSHFGSLEWLPDGSALLFEGEKGHLFVANLSGAGGSPRDLGPWYQGFSISPDGSTIVHAVNSPNMGLEVLDIATGRRTLIHKSSRIVWGATYSPDGKSIAYLATLRDPPGTSDDDADCTPPTIGLRIYSLVTKSDSEVTIRSSPKNWDNVKSFRWSPDSKRLAITLGTTDCDYPGDAVGVFVTTIDRRSQLRASQGTMSFEPVFSPDSGSVVYVDFSDSIAKLIRYDITTGMRTRIREATEENNYYHLLDFK
jgi:Tol biopolymer transport system component